MFGGEFFPFTGVCCMTSLLCKLDTDTLKFGMWSPFPNFAVTGLLSECEMLQKLLGQFMNLRVVSDKPTWAQVGSPSLVFCHHLTGKPISSYTPLSKHTSLKSNTKFIKDPMTLFNIGLSFCRQCSLCPLHQCASIESAKSWNKLHHPTTCVTCRLYCE